jgi:hypothetical protein
MSDGVTKDDRQGVFRIAAYGNVVKTISAYILRKLGSGPDLKTSDVRLCFGENRLLNFSCRSLSFLLSCQKEFDTSQSSGVQEHGQPDQTK